METDRQQLISGSGIILPEGLAVIMARRCRESTHSCRIVAGYGIVLSLATGEGCILHPSVLEVGAVLADGGMEIDPIRGTVSVRHQNELRRMLQEVAEVFSYEGRIDMPVSQLVVTLY